MSSIRLDIQDIDFDYDEAVRDILRDENRGLLYKTLSKGAGIGPFYFALDIAKNGPTTEISLKPPFNVVGLGRGVRILGKD